MPAISPTISVACAAERFATSMWLVPAYRRVGPLLRGQQAISRTSKPATAAQSATSMSGVAGNGAVRNPSFIAVEPPGSTGGLRRSCRPGDLDPPALRELSSTASPTSISSWPSAKVA